jgi:hypothetical protein
MSADGCAGPRLGRAIWQQRRGGPVFREWAASCCVSAKAGARSRNAGAGVAFGGGWRSERGAAGLAAHLGLGGLDGRLLVDLGGGRSCRHSRQQQHGRGQAESPAGREKAGAAGGEGGWCVCMLRGWQLPFGGCIRASGRAWPLLPLAWLETCERDHAFERPRHADRRRSNTFVPAHLEIAMFQAGWDDRGSSNGFKNQKNNGE